MGKYIAAVDIGGTFSDLVCLDTVSGEIKNVKVPSTPPTFIEGVMNALKKAGIPPSEMIVFKHGSTIATNAIIQRRGAKTGLVATKGFRDILEAARADRPELFDLSWDPNPPLVPRRHRLGVSERVDYEGNVVTPLNEEEVRHAARLFKKRGIEAVAICFLNSFMNPEHERRTKEILKQEMPQAYICHSYEIFPEIKEFERTSTTAVNAYLGPIVDRYLADLTKELTSWGYKGDTLIIHSGGGVMSLDAAREIPARTCQSGPAGGVVGGAYIGQMSGFPNVITFDIGGTSTDLAVTYRGQPPMESGWKVEWKIPIRFPCIDVHSIGAGGGSIAWIDKGGTLKNGPQSAGANPGPACYGLGGKEPTNTDCHLVLGRLNPETFLGGDMTVKPDLAHKAIKGKIADFFGMSVEEAADGILRVANANIAYATRLISVERGYDPREFALLAFGGGGPLHAAEAARELKIPKVLVPQYPGLASAFGQLQVEIRQDYLRPLLQLAKEVELARVNQTYRELETNAREALRREGVAEKQIELQRFADVKYFPQTEYFTLPIPSREIAREDIDGLVRDFLARHEQEFGYTVPVEFADVEVVNARLVAKGPAPKGELKKHPEKGNAKEALKGERKVYFREAGGWVMSQIYDRAKLRCGASFKGPAIVEQSDSTTVVPPGVKATVDEYLNLVLDLSS